MWGPTFPELVDALPGIEIIDRAKVMPSTMRVCLARLKRPAERS
jgi:hypothetical protein